MNKDGFGNSFIACLFIYLLLFYLTYLFMYRFHLLNFQIFIYALVASFLTTYVLHNRI
jgi:hypothetical protein